MERRIKRGEIYFADLDPVKGSEQAGFRPVLILQNDIGNTYSTTTIVAPITSKMLKKKALPTHYGIYRLSGLEQDSVVLLEQIRTLDTKRLAEYIGTLNAEQMQGINTAVTVSLGLT